MALLSHKDLEHKEKKQHDKSKEVSIHELQKKVPAMTPEEILHRNIGVICKSP